MRTIWLYLVLFSLTLANTGLTRGQEKKDPPKESKKDLALSARLQAAKQITDFTMRNRALQDVVVDLADAGESALVKQTLDALPAAVKQTLLVPCAMRLAEAGDSVGALEMSKAIGSQAERNKVLEAIARFGGNGQALLFEAARNGEANRVRKAIKRGADFNATTEGGKTALHLAVEGGHTSVIAALLEAGASVTLKDGNGRTALELAKSSSHKTLADLFGEGDSDTRLVEAVKAGKTILVKQLLEKGGNPNLTTDGQPFLYHAASYGNTTLLKLLLEHDANVNVSYDSKTPLVVAVDYGHAACVRALLASGAISGKDMEEALRRALKHGHHAVVAELAERGARVSARPDGRTPSLLNLAVRNCNAATVKLLIEKGADVNTRASEGDNEDKLSPLRVAIEKDAVEMVRHLLDGKATVSEEDTRRALDRSNLEIVTLLVEKGATLETNTLAVALLHAASVRGDLRCIRALLAKKAPLDGKMYGGGRTPLMEAARAGHIEAVKLLLAAGADRAVADQEGNMPFDLARGSAELRELLLDDSIKLRQAAAAGQIEEVKKLLEAKVPVDPKEGKSEPALVAAARAGRLEVVKLLLVRGANVHASLGGQTALRHAVRREALELVRLLLEHGAEVHPDAAGQTEMGLWLGDLLALGKTAGEGDVEKVKGFLGKKLDPNVFDSSGYTPLMRAISGNQIEVVKLLLENGAKPDLRNRNGETALFNAAYHGREAIVSLLLEKKANVNLSNANKETPLLAAIDHNHVAIVPLLLAAKADVNLASRDNRTPLLAAITSSGIPTGKEELVKQLLAAKADVNVVDKTGTPALSLAVKTSNAEVVKMLLEAKADPTALDKEGRTALEYASRASIVELLKAAMKSKEPK